ncbi:MAG: DUF2071 domain-containing protein [Agriterribacter sp.]
MKPFLTANWLHLAMANYEIAPSILQPFVPPKTALDYYNGVCYVSLIGFRFWDTKIKGVAIPFHSNFEEINLRFYVRYKEDNIWKRGVVFIKEIVPKFAISFIANAFYQERYVTMPTTSIIAATPELLSVQYQWGNGLLNKIAVNADPAPYAIADNSIEAFITEHYWGYAKQRGNHTKEYEVAHPRWNIYAVKNYDIVCDFEKLYGSAFSILNQTAPLSVLLAQGSAVKVFQGKKI